MHLFVAQSSSEMGLAPIRAQLPGQACGSLWLMEAGGSWRGRGLIRRDLLGIESLKAAHCSSQGLQHMSQLVQLSPKKHGQHRHRHQRLAAHSVGQPDCTHPTSQRLLTTCCMPWWNTCLNQPGGCNEARAYIQTY